MKKNDEIDLMEIVKLFKKNLKKILICGIICALVTGIMTAMFVEPKYTSSMKFVIINQTQPVITYNDVQTSTQLVGDCVEIIKSRDLMEDIKDTLDIRDLSVGQLKNNIQVNSPTGTRVLSITVTDTNPLRAMRIAVAVYELGGEYIKNSLDIDAVNIIEQPVAATAPSSPNVPRNTLSGGILGVVLMAAFIVITKLVNNKFNTVDEIESELEITVLAAIPKSGLQSKKRLHRSVIINNDVSDAD